MTAPDTAAHIFAHSVDAYQDSAEEVGHPEGQPIIETFPQLTDLIERAIRADRQQFAPYINMIRKAIVNTEKNPMLGYLPLMIVAAQFADVIEDGMVEK